MISLVFWVATGLLMWVYVGYPATAWLVAAVRPFRVRPGGTHPAIVTIGIAIHDEAAQLDDRIADVLAQEVPFELDVIIASDGSTDETAQVAAAAARRDARIRLLDLPRGGQAAAQAAIFAASRGEIVVLTDAETRFRPGSLAALLAPFDDPRVGATTGRIVWLDEERTETARNEGAYWRYEQFVRAAESRAGWLTAVTGAILAIRRSAYREVPPHVSMDQQLPLVAREQGLVVLAVPDATATDRTMGDVNEQFRSRARMATQGIRANLSMVGRLTPWRRPSAFLAIWSHKILRWATPILAAIAAASAVALGLGGEPGYLVPVAAGVVVLLLAAFGWALRARGHSPRLGSLPLAIVVVNLAFLNGWLNLLVGRRIEAWQRERLAVAPTKPDREPGR